jgi:hypothetical protein
MCGDVGDEATTFPYHVQAKALEQTIKDSVPDGVGITHVSHGETRWIPQGKDCGWRKQTARLHFQGRCKFANRHHRSAVLLSCIIKAEEERDVTVIDIPNAFIQT